MAVADITSALFSRRSYREKMPKADVLEILGKMALNDQLDASVVGIMTERYDEITSASAAKSSDIVRSYEALKIEYPLCVKEYIKGSKDTGSRSELFF